MTDYHSLLLEVLERAPSSETLCTVLGEFEKNGHTREVIREGIRALGRHPENPGLRLILAEAFFKEGRLSQAEAQIETAVSRMDSYAGAYLLRAEIYHRQKRDQEALRSLEIYLAHRPQDKAALDLLGEIKATVGEPAAARAPEPLAPTATEPAAAQSEKPGPLIEEEALSEIATPTLAEVYVNQGQTQEALNIYEKLLAQNPGDQVSLKRFQELKALLAIGSAMPEDKPKIGGSNRSKRRTIAVLESWLTNLRKMSGPSLSA